MDSHPFLLMIALYIIRTKDNNINGSQPVVEQQLYRFDTVFSCEPGCSGYFELLKQVTLPASNFEVLQL